MVISTQAENSKKDEILRSKQDAFEKATKEHRIRYDDASRKQIKIEEAKSSDRELRYDNISEWSLDSRLNPF